MNDPLKALRTRVAVDRRLTRIKTTAANSKKPYAYRRPIPDDLWIKCPGCDHIVSKDAFYKAGSVCVRCDHHYRLGSRIRLEMICDRDSFSEWDANLVSVNPLEFDGYTKKLAALKSQTNLKEALISGQATIDGQPVAIAVMDSHFLMGSMGSAVGEKICRLFERAAKLGLPVVLFVASGGARMQEGILSLMQMAKTSAAVAKYRENGLPYIAVLTDPSTGGVMASFASLADLILAEPGALIGFAGRRVIEGTLSTALPEGFQRAEFLLEHGFIDLIVPRSELKRRLSQLLGLHQPTKVGASACDFSKQTEADDPSQGDLSAADRLSLVRHRQRPTITDYLPLIFDDLVELHGDRLYGDDPAIWCGLGRLNGRPVTVIGQRKGRTLEENARFRFGMVHPEGYRKALRLMQQAERFGRPIITFVDTPGAFCGVGAEERGQSAAIAENLLAMSRLQVPLITVVTGEGGSGGALAIAAGDRLGMLSNALYSVISPRGFASLLWKDPTLERQAAQAMKITAQDLIGFKVADSLIAEPKEGAHTDPAATAAAIKRFFCQALSEVDGFSGAELIELRRQRFRRLGRFLEE